MDLSVFDPGPMSPTARERSAGRDVLEAKDGLFADALLEIADIRDTESYDPIDDLDREAEAFDDLSDDDETEASETETTEAKTTLTEALGSDTTVVPDLELATVSADATTLLASSATGSTAASQAASTSAGAAVGTPPAALAKETITPLNQQASGAAAALQGEARVLTKRSDTIATNEKHAQGVKAQLGGANTQATSAANAQAATNEGGSASLPANSEAKPATSEIARLDQALRQAFPAAPQDGASPQPSAPAANQPLRPVADTLLASRSADQSIESSSHLGSGGERPSPVATAKAAAARPAFNLPAGRPAEQVSVQIQNGIRNGNDRIQIKLTPASMGTVEVKLELSPDKTVQAIVMADKPETLEILERDARVLQKALEEAGLRTNSDSLSFAQRDPGGSNNAQADSGNSAASGADGDDGDGVTAGDNDQQIETQARRSHDGLIDIEA